MSAEEGLSDLEFLMSEVLRVRDIDSKLWSDLTEVRKYLEELEGALRVEFAKNGLTSCKDREGNNFSVRITETLGVNDFDAFMKFVIDTGNFQLLQKRVATTAAKEVCESMGSMIPGLVSKRLQTITVRKA